METMTGPGGEALFVDEAERERGSKGPFLVVYRDSEGRRRWGYFCGHCDSFDTAMDPMGRIKCTACDNVKRPDRWDAAHE